MDVEYIRLFYDIHSENITGHLFRGYTVVGSKTSEESPRDIKDYSGMKRPIWFVFSGMGSQWPGMGMSRNFSTIIKKKKTIYWLNNSKNNEFYRSSLIGESLMKFPIFAKAIQKCDAVLKPRGVDIVDIITNKNKKTFDNILNSFVGIAAVQVK